MNVVQIQDRCHWSSLVVIRSAYTNFVNFPLPATVHGAPPAARGVLTATSWQLATTPDGGIPVKVWYATGDTLDAWLKIRTTGRQEFVIIGWRPPEYGTDDVRGLFLATYEDGELVYRGAVGTGFTDKMRRQIFEVLIRADAPPKIKGMPRAETRVAHWV